MAEGLEAIMATAQKQMEALKPTLVEIANSVNEIDGKLASATGGDTLNQSTVISNAVETQGDVVRKAIDGIVAQLDKKGGEYTAAFYKLIQETLKETVRPKVSEYVSQVNAENQVTDSGIDPDALRKERKELMDNFRALKAAFAAYPDIDLSDVPQVKKLGGGRKKGALTNKKKGAAFYVKGEKFLSFAQAASAATKDLENVGRGKETAPTAYLRQALKDANIPSTQDNPYKKAPWLITLPNGVEVRAVKVDESGNEVEEDSAQPEPVGATA